MFGKMNIEKIASKIKAKKARLSDFNLSSDERAEVIKLLKKKSHVDVTTKFIKESAKAYDEGRLVLDADFNDEDIKEAIRTTAEAYRFMDAYVNEDGTGNCGEDKSYFISERLRKGYVGAEITTNDGILLQTERGKPYGTAVAIPTDDENIVIGYSFIGKDEKYSIPGVGLYLAYKRAGEGRAAGKQRTAAEEFTEYEEPEDTSDHYRPCGRSAGAGHCPLRNGPGRAEETARYRVRQRGLSDRAGSGRRDLCI